MYKKITHTIVEEHFDHPIASQIKKSLGHSKLITNEVFSEDKFRTDVHSYFIKYQGHLNSLINAITSTDEELLTAFDNFFKTCWVDDLGNMTKPLYSSEFGERINEAMRLTATGIFLTIQSLKMGKDSGLQFGRLQFTANEFAQNLDNFNNLWQYPVINTLFINLYTDMINRAKARQAKNSSLEMQLAQKNTESWETFEKTLVDGIIKQHPERFTKPTSMSTSYNSNDIM
jgi:hypothetical protein